MYKNPSNSVIFFNDLMQTIRLHYKFIILACVKSRWIIASIDSMLLEAKFNYCRFLKILKQKFYNINAYLACFIKIFYTSGQSFIAIFFCRLLHASLIIFNLGKEASDKFYK